MLRVDRDGKRLSRLEQQSLSEVGWKERQDLQEMIRNSPDAFFAEMGEELLLVGEEIRPTDFVQDRIDLLAIDQHGAAVVIELKRGSKKLQLLQALTYAAMVAKWDPARLVEERQKFSGQSTDDTESEIEEFLVEEPDSLNSAQRIILMAEDFDYEVLVTAEWLSDQYEIDIRCYRLKLSVENDSEFLSSTCIYPPPEITEHAVKRGRRTSKRVRWEDWDEALAGIANGAIVGFFRSELEAGREDYLRKRTLHYRCGGKRRFSVEAHKDRAYVWQYRRFAGDAEFWKKKIGEHIDLDFVRDDNSGLRFFLSSEEDFAKFLEAIDKDMPSVQFLSRGETPEDDDVED